MASASPLRLGILALLVLLVPAGASQVAACGDGGDASGGGDADDGGLPGVPSDAASDGGGGGGPATTMRLAHLAPELGALDFCYQTAHTAAPFIGPVLGGGGKKQDAGAGAPGVDASTDAGAPPDADTQAGDADAPDADTEAAAAVRARQVSRYLALETSGPLTIALVRGGASSCANPLFVADVTLDPGKLFTVAAMGRLDADGGSEALAVVAFTDDRATVADRARVRVVSAGDADGPLLAATALGASAVTLADRVEPRRAASPSPEVPVDALGYATVAPLPPPASIAVGPVADAGADAAAAWQSTAIDLGLDGGSLHTAFVLPAGAAYEVIWCDDRTTIGLLTSCYDVR